VLDFQFEASQTLRFTVYGKAGATYLLDRLSAPLGQGAWSQVPNLILTNLQVVGGIKLTNPPAFYRLRQP
jgi:hypothetical protein